MADRDLDVEELMPLRKRLSLRPEIEPQQQQQEVEELPENFKNKIIEMRGTEETQYSTRHIKTVLLRDIDIDKGESRLSIPLSKLLRHSFLTLDEKETLEERIKGNMKGSLNVKVTDPSLEVWELKFRKYDMVRDKS
ncbi:unnamed protein product [Arabis nemorensis]|uniref:Uncharacterized protein n=1 Tax=Arabis nemorensis TaxID=586526 RepID=A0A565BQ41_9BRAS|nr:unnamed protein product [Arabis nemorensis]